MRLLFLFSCFLFLLGYFVPSHFSPWLSAYHELLAFTSIVLMGLITAACSSKITLPRSTLFFLLVLCIPWLQYQFDIIYFFGDVLQSSYYLVGFILAFSIAYHLSQYRYVSSVHIYYFYSFFYLISIIGIFTSLAIILQWLQLSSDLPLINPHYSGRPSANFNQPNHAATFLGFSIATTAYLFEKKKMPISFTLGVIVLCLFSIALTGSRTGWLGVTVLSMLLLFKTKQLNLRVSPVSIVVCLSFFIASILSIPWLSNLLDVNSTYSLLERSTTATRWQMYQQLWLAIEQSPWFGYGWLQTMVGQSTVVSQHWIPMTIHYSHNIVLDFLLWNGPILGLILVISFAVYLIALLLKASSVLAIYAWVGFSFFCFHSLLEFPFAYIYILMPAGFFFGFIQHSSGNTRYTVKLPKIAAITILSSCLLVSLICWYEYILLSKENQELYLNYGDFEELPIAAMQPISHATFLKSLEDEVTFNSLVISDGYANQQLSFIERYARRYPRRFYLFKAIVILAVNGREDSALSLTQLLHEISNGELDDELKGYLASRVQSYPKIADYLRYQL